MVEGGSESLAYTEAGHELLGCTRKASLEGVNEEVTGSAFNHLTAHRRLPQKISLFPGSSLEKAMFVPSPNSRRESGFTRRHR